MRLSEKEMNRAYYAAAKCQHVPVGACLTCIGASLAAAEERGRRRGIEEANKLRVILLHVRRWMRADSPSWVKAEADAVLPCNLTDLAPRDSARAFVEKLPRAPDVEHMLDLDAPRDSGKDAK